jgi:hypothetical protein
MLLINHKSYVSKTLSHLSAQNCGVCESIDLILTLRCVECSGVRSRFEASLSDGPVGTNLPVSETVRAGTLGGG